MNVRKRLKSLFWPELPVYPETVQKRTARILNVLLVITILLTAVSAVVQGMFAPASNRLFNIISNSLEALIGIALLYWLRRGAFRTVSRIIVLAAYLGSTYPLAAYADIGVGTAVFSYLVTISLAVMLLSTWETVGLLALVGITFPLIQMGIDSGTLTPSLTPPDPRSMIFSYLTVLGIGGAALTLATYNLSISLQNEHTSLLAAKKANQELQDINADLENIITERTRALTEQAQQLEQLRQQAETRSQQLEAIAQVTRATLQEIGNVAALLTRIADLIHQHFGFYHVGIFLLDEEGRYAILQAVNRQSTGGQAMLARQHKLFVGRTGVVGAVAATGQPRIVLDTSSDAVFFDNPDLPDTHSEMALPLIVRRRIIGVLDIQSTQPDAFDEEDLHIFTILADQIAHALDNSQRLQEAERMAREASLVYRDTIQQGWRSLARRHKVLGIQRNAGYKTFIGKPREYPAEIRRILQTAPYHREATPRGERLLVPIRLREQVVGVIELEASSINDDLIAIIREVAERVALATENIRLLEDAHQRAERERRISTFSAQLSTSVSVQNILRIAAEEIGQLLPGSEVTIQFAEPKDTPQDA